MHPSSPVPRPHIAPEPAPPPDDDAPCCATCGGMLDLVQPDPSRPARLLGVCTGCGAWHLCEQVCLPPVVLVPAVRRA